MYVSIRNKDQLPEFSSSIYAESKASILGLVTNPENYENFMWTYFLTIFENIYFTRWYHFNNIHNWIWYESSFIIINARIAWEIVCWSTSEMEYKFYLEVLCFEDWGITRPHPFDVQPDQMGSNLFPLFFCPRTPGFSNLSFKNKKRRRLHDFIPGHVKQSLLFILWSLGTEPKRGIKWMRS